MTISVLPSKTGMIRRRWLLGTVAATVQGKPLSHAPTGQGRRAGVRNASVTDFGAAADGLDIDQNTRAFAMAFERGRGTCIHVPSGTYRLKPGILKLPEHTILQGDGYNTVLDKADNGVLLSFAGKSSRDHSRYSVLRDLRLTGGGKTGPLLDMRFADNLLCDNVQFEANDDTAILMVESWDSRFRDCVFERVGAAPAAPAVRIRNTPKNILGMSADNSNQIHFVGCRWEQFADGALWIGDRADGNVVNGIYLVDCKMETSRLSGSVLAAHGATRGLFVVNLYVAVNAFGDPTPGPGVVDLITCGNVSESSFQNLHIYTAVPIRTDLRLTTSNKVAVSTIFHDGAAAPAHAVIQVDSEENLPWIGQISVRGPSPGQRLVLVDR